jgi:light-harvesting complex I chlorophyll a/b binding protein 1
MSIADMELEAGKVAPFPEGFDPLGLSKDKSFKELKKWREAELKHGRVAMLAVLGTAVQENYHPLWGFNEKEMDGAIFHFQEIQNVYPLFWTTLLFVIGLIEARTIGTLWDEGMAGKTEIAGIKEDVICGNLGLDPLKIIENDDEEAFLDYRNKELNNGRLAMIAAAGITVQEKFITGGLPEFEFHRFALSDVYNFFF